MDALVWHIPAYLGKRRAQGCVRMGNPYDFRQTRNDPHNRLMSMAEAGVITQKGDRRNKGKSK